MDNVERAGPNMNVIARDTFGETLEFRVRIKSNAHVSVEVLKEEIVPRENPGLLSVIFIKENKHFNRESEE